MYIKSSINPILISLYGVFTKAKALATLYFNLGNPYPSELDVGR
jgi:hypothetical protein